MKNSILFLFLTFVGIVGSQTIIEYDYMETSSTLYLSAGWWTPAVTTGWYTNASVTPTTSAVLYGSGTGTSANEQDWYSMPNVTGLNTAHQYQLKFRLASYTFTGPTATTRGLDAADILEVQVSTNGGVTYISELRVTGNSNAQWPYTSTGTITHTANGVWTNSAAPAGDVYQAPAGVTTTGPSTVTLNLPSNISQVAIDIFCRANSTAEEWWIDNIELWDMTPISLPVELISFEGSNTPQGNTIIWKTATEHNSDYYLIERSTTGEFTEKSIIGQKQAAGNSTMELSYTFIDNDFEPTINYYRLVQVDIDGHSKIYGPIVIENTYETKKVIKVINLRGQEVTEFTTTGIYIEVYEDGTMKRVWKP